MIDEVVKSRVLNVIALLKTHQPMIHKDSPNYLLTGLLRDCQECSEEAWLSAIKVFIEDELYLTKPVRYFKAIIINKENDIRIIKNKEQKSLGYIPEEEL